VGCPGSLRPHASYTSSLRPHALKFRLLICARGMLRGTFRMLHHTCRMRYVLCYRIRVSYATYATSYVSHTLRMLPHPCLIRYVCYLIRVSYATYATSGVLLGAKGDVHQRGRRLRLRQVPHTLRMLQHTCPIRYVCYSMRAPYATYATSYVPHALRTSERSAPPTSSGASYATYATSYVPHALRTSERSAPPTSSGASYATYATSYVPHTLRMLTHTCVILYVCYVMLVSYAN
jgi:hypothetical protein